MAEKRFFKRGAGKGIPAFETEEAKRQGLTAPVYNEAIRVDATDHTIIFAAGCTGTDYEAGKVVSEDVKGQAIQCMKNIERIVTTAGGQMKDVVRLRVYVTPNELTEERINEVYDAIDPFLVEGQYPAISFTGITELVRGIGKIEIEADAVLAK